MGCAACVLRLSVCTCGRPHVCSKKALPWIASQCLCWRDTDNKNLPALHPPCSVWLFLHQGQQHLPALSRCSHGNASKELKDRQKLRERVGEKNKPEILCYYTVVLLIVPVTFLRRWQEALSHISFPFCWRWRPKCSTACRCCVEIQGTQVTHSTNINCTHLSVSGYANTYFSGFEGIPPCSAFPVWWKQDWHRREPGAWGVWNQD